MRNIFLILTAVFACMCGCYVESDNDNSEPLFTAPVEIEQPNETTLTPNQPTVAPEPTINNEMVQIGNKDSTAPKLVESSVDSGRVEPETEVMSLRFNEDIVEIDIKLVDALGDSMGWTTSLDTTTGRRIILARINGRRIGADRTYRIEGSVADEGGNETLIDIEFRAVEENRDRAAPRIVKQAINHGQVNVSIDIDRFVFTFDENIDHAEVTLVRGAEWPGESDMRWDMCIHNREVALVKTTGKSTSLRNNQTYIIGVRARDEAGNWFPGPNTVRIFRFTTQR